MRFKKMGLAWWDKGQVCGNLNIWVGLGKGKGRVNEARVEKHLNEGLFLTLSVWFNLTRPK